MLREYKILVLERHGILDLCAQRTSRLLAPKEAP